MNTNYNFYNNQTNVKSFNTSFNGGKDSVEITGKVIKKNKNKLLTRFFSFIGLGTEKKLRERDVEKILGNLRDSLHENPQKAEKMIDKLIEKHVG